MIPSMKPRYFLMDTELTIDEVNALSPMAKAEVIMDDDGVKTRPFRFAEGASPEGEGGPGNLSEDGKSVLI